MGFGHPKYGQGRHGLHGLKISPAGPECVLGERLAVKGSR